jgi:hypothetical protein
MAKKNEVAQIDDTSSQTEATSTALTGEVLEAVPPLPPREGRKHRASYSRDKRTAKFNIWVEGPDATKFAGRYIPVSRFDQSESMEKLTKLVWSGPNPETGVASAVYEFVANPRAKKEREVVAF